MSGRVWSFAQQNVFHSRLDLSHAPVRPSRSIRPTLSLSWLEHACEPWLHVRRCRHEFSDQIGLTNVSNHDGKNLTISALVEAIHSVYHLTKPLAFLMTITGVLFCGNGRTVDLHQLAKHNAIEHDASLSRPDTQPPSKFAPIDADPEIVDQLMRISPENFLVLKDIATHRVNRESQAVGGPLDFIHAEIARAEFSLLLQVFGNDNMEVDKDLLRNWFVEGRLPDSWKAPEKTIGILTSVALTRRIAAAVKAIRNSKEE